MKNQTLTYHENPDKGRMNVLHKVGQFAWRHKGKIIIGGITLATGGMAAPAIATAMGGAGLLGAASTGTAISTLHGCALASASLASASITGTVAGGAATIAGAGATVGTALGTVVDKLTNKKK